MFLSRSVRIWLWKCDDEPGRSAADANVPPTVADEGGVGQERRRRAVACTMAAASALFVNCHHASACGGAQAAALAKVSVCQVAERNTADSENMADGEGCSRARGAAASETAWDDLVEVDDVAGVCSAACLPLALLTVFARTEPDRQARAARNQG